MPDVRITITGMVETEKGIRQIRRNMQKTSPLMNMLGRAMRDDARLRITTQDGGTYTKLSKWTRARTNRRKAFVTEKKNITFKRIGGLLLIGHNASGWSFEQHRRGFETAGFSGKTVVIPLKNPGALRDVKRSFIAIRSAKSSVTPARQVFPTEPQATRIVEKEVTIWLNRIVKKARAI